MKQVLLGTSALMAAGLTATPAAAQLELLVDGTIQFMAGVYDEDESGTNDDERHHRFGTDVQFDIGARGVSDGGIVYGATMDLEDNGGSGFGVDEAIVFLSGGFGTLVLGNDDGANDIADNVPETATDILDGDYKDYITNLPALFWDAADSSDAAKVYYRTTGIAGAPGVEALVNRNIMLGLSYAPDVDGALDPGDPTRPGNPGDEPAYAHFFEIGAAWSPRFGEVTVTPSAALSYAVTGANGLRNAYLSGQATLNVAYRDLDVGVGFVHRGEAVDGDDENWGVNAGATYTTGPWTFGVQYAYGHDEVLNAQDRESHSFGAGVDYDLMPGLDLEGEVVGFTTDAAADNSGVVGLTRVNLSF